MLNNFLKNIFSFSRSKVDPKMWINSHELSVFYKSIIWLCNVSESTSSLKMLNNRISFLVASNSYNFAFTYLKESLRLTIRFLSGSPERLCATSIRVSVDSSGLPKIIPLSLRNSLRDPAGSVNIRRAILILLSCFRVFKVDVKPDTDSITKPFSGTSRTFSYEIVSKALNDMKFKARFGAVKGFISEKAGPHSKYSTWGLPIDACALWFFPRNLFAVIKILFTTKSYMYLLSLLLTMLTTVPVYYILAMLGKIQPLVLGRLSVVYDQAGKARIVAITNAWIQLVLKPLHLSIFKFLKTLETDGTFDQSKPLQRLISIKLAGHKYHCFDLSSATDRLPIDLQEDILTFSGLDGSLWRQLLDIEWKWQNTYVKYAVGQPMGAYSSWAMLAVTHHVIVRIASLQVGLPNFSHYCVLGDDIVINHDDVAAKYLQLMETLGVGINMSKSIVSSDMVEFAKRWITPTGDISPLGPGNLLYTSRYPASVGSLLIESVQKGYIENPMRALQLIGESPYEGQTAISLWTCFGINGLFQGKGQVDMQMLTWCTYGGRTDPTVLRYSYYNGFLAVIVNNIREAMKINDKEEQRFNRNWYKATGTSSHGLRILELLGTLTSPSFWLYWTSFVLTREDHYNSLNTCFVNRAGTWSDISLIASLADSSIGQSIDWSRKETAKIRVKEFGAFYKSVQLSIDQVYDETSMDVY